VSLNATTSLKKIFTLLIISVLATNASCQEIYVVKSEVNHQSLIDSLKNKVDQSWIRKNPSFKSTKHSFFSHANENNYYVGLMQMSGHGTPFVNDDDLSLLRYLIRRDSGITVVNGEKANQEFQGTKIFWNQKQYGLIWYNRTIFKAEVYHWSLFETTDCGPIIIFPTLDFLKVDEVPNARFNNISGLAMFPYEKNITINEKELRMKTMDGSSISGSGYDLNLDQIPDVFIYDEDLDESNSYTRIFLNVDGEWKCKWISLNQTCI
jgi:hypothetical protein